MCLFLADFHCLLLFCSVTVTGMNNHSHSGSNRCRLACVADSVTNIHWTLVISHWRDGTETAVPPSTQKHRSRTWLVKTWQWVLWHHHIQETPTCPPQSPSLWPFLFVLSPAVNRDLLGPTAHVKRWAGPSRWDRNEVTFPLSGWELVWALLAPVPPPCLLLLFPGNPPTLFPSREET